MTNHYDVLGVSRDAKPAAIKAAYRRLRGVAHPDRKSGSTEAMALLNVAYETLADADKRRHYDETGDDRVPPLDKRARDALLGAFQQALQQEGDNDPVAEARVILLDRMQATAASISEGEANLVELLDRRKRIKFKGADDDNFLIRVVDDFIGPTRISLARLKETLPVLERALVVSSEYGYKAKKRLPVSWPTTTASTAIPSPGADEINQINRAFWSTQ